MLIANFQRLPLIFEKQKGLGSFFLEKRNSLEVEKLSFQNFVLILGDFLKES